MEFYDPQNNYLDTTEFRVYTVAVYDAITGRMSIGDLRRAMGDKFKSEWIWDAINALEGVGSIRKVWGVPSRFERNPRGPMDGKGVLPGPAAPADKSKPMGSSYDFSRNVTA